MGQVAIGAISEADRHNIRGEHISVDTIPLVGEQPLADAVRAVVNLPRARAVVLAGSIMGGEIVDAVKEVREQGLLVVSLNMAGSVPDAADLVVTDPVQAGVMTVMAVADTASSMSNDSNDGKFQPALIFVFPPGARICQLFLYPIQCRGVVIADERLFLAVVSFGPAFGPNEAKP